MFIQILIITVVIIAFFFVALALKVLFKKEKEVKKSCTSQLKTTDGKSYSCTCGSNNNCANKS